MTEVTLIPANPDGPTIINVAEDVKTVTVTGTLKAGAKPSQIAPASQHAPRGVTQFSVACSDPYIALEHVNPKTVVVKGVPAPEPEQLLHGLPGGEPLG